MKKSKILIILVAIVLLAFNFIGCSNKSKTEIDKVKLNEVVRSVFYAPMYVAINEGLFEEENIEIDLTTGQGADATYSK